MNTRTVRARIVLDEARTLGIDLADLIAAEHSGAALPTLAGYLDEIAATFTAATATTHRPYWRLAAARLGDRRLAEIMLAPVASMNLVRVVRCRVLASFQSGAARRRIAARRRFVTLIPTRRPRPAPLATPTRGW